MDILEIPEKIMINFSLLVSSWWHLPGVEVDCGSRYPRYLPGVEVPVAAVAGEALLVPHLALPGEHLQMHWLHFFSFLHCPFSNVSSNRLAIEHLPILSILWYFATLILYFVMVQESQVHLTLARKQLQIVIIKLWVFQCFLNILSVDHL